MIQGTKGYIKVPGRPGIVKNVVLSLHEGKTVSLDVSEETDPMGTEFLRMEKVMNENDRKTAEEWLAKSLFTMEILAEAGKSK